MATALNVSAWSTTAASNDGADSTIGTVANTSAPNVVDDWVRGIMASVKKYVLDTDGGITAGGTANALTITTNRVISSGHQAAGFSVRFKAGATNTGAATVAVDGLSAVSIKRINGDALGAGDIISGAIYDIAFDGTNYQLLGANTPSASLSGSSLEVTGNATVGGTLGVTGATTLSSTLAVTGTSTFTGAVTMNGGGTLGDAAGDTVVIKGTTVNSFMSGLFSNASASALVNATVGALSTTSTPTSSNNGRWLVDTAGGSGTWRRMTDVTAVASLLNTLGTTQGNILWYDGTGWAVLAPHGQPANKMLIQTSTGVLSWANIV